MSEKPRAEDPRPARTRALLFGALIELMQDRRWERIRVQDILDHTGVGRSTFYAHFDNKFDLLTADLPLAISIGRDEDGRLDLVPLFAHVLEMKAIVRPLLTQPLLGEVTAVLERTLVEAWLAHLSEVGVEAERQPLASELLAGAWLGVAKRWLLDDCPTPAITIAADFTRYAQGVIDLAID